MPNNRNRGGRPPRKPGQMGQYRELWARVHNIEVVQYVVPGSENSEAGEPIVTLTFSSDRRTMSLRLTSMTEAELEALDGVWRRTVDAARPICARLDANAKQAWEEDRDDSFTRLYRTVPTVHERQRK